MHASVLYSYEYPCDSFNESTTLIVYYLNILVFYVKESLCYVYTYEYCILLHF